MSITMNMHMDVLDAYAKRLTKGQVNKLYENKCGKTYKRVLNESSCSFVDTNDYQLYLNAYTIALELDANKTELMMELNDKYHSVMENLSYRIDSDAILFSTTSKEKYGKLMEALSNIGFSADTLMSIRDEKY